MRLVLVGADYEENLGMCMIAAAAGHLPPVAGAIAQEVVDIVVVLNALRVAWPPKALTDFRAGG